MKQPLRRPPTARREQIAIAGLLVLLFCAVTPRAAQAATVPDFSLQVFDGKSISLKDYRGKPILVNFFHSK